MIFQSYFSKLDQKKYFTFSHCYTNLGTSCSLKEATDSFFPSFVEHFKKDHENVICVTWSHSENRNIENKQKLTFLLISANIDPFEVRSLRF